MIKLTKDSIISEISYKEYNVHEINRISKEYRGLRQESKAPT